MTYRVQILPSAEREFEQLYRYIAKRAPRGAAAWANAFYKALKSLRRNPGRHPLAPEDDDHEIDIRQLLFKTRQGRVYRALFTIRDDNVFILHIRGAGQDVVSAEEMDLPE